MANRTGTAAALTALMTMAASVQAAETVRWVGGPWPLDNPSPARNPAVAFGGNTVHIVYRIRAGGIGHVCGDLSGSPTPEQVLPGSNTAATSRDKNYPDVVVGDDGHAHVAWAPMSAAGNGAYYVRIDAGGAPVGSAQRITDRWVEYLAVELGGGEVHVPLTAIDTTEGTYDLHAPLTGGVFTETTAWFAPLFYELDARTAPGVGLVLIGHDGPLRRVASDFSSGAWAPRSTHDRPVGVTSVGRPRVAFDGATELWAAIGWDAMPVPTSVWVTEAVAAQQVQAWSALATGGLFDPVDEDGEPLAELVVNGFSERALAWLDDDAPRLRLSIGADQWGAPAVMPGTDAATTFAMCAQDENRFRLVWANDDGSLHTGVAALVRDDGDGCAAGHQCASGYCVDDVCCDSPCDGGLSDDCRACSVTAGASLAGSCGPVSDDSPCATGICLGGVCVAGDGGGGAGGASGGAGKGGVGTDTPVASSENGCGCRQVAPPGALPNRRPSQPGWLLLALLACGAGRRKIRPAGAAKTAYPSAPTAAGPR